MGTEVEYRFGIGGLSVSLPGKTDVEEERNGTTFGGGRLVVEHGGVKTIVTVYPGRGKEADEPGVTVVLHDGCNMTVPIVFYGMISAYIARN